MFPNWFYETNITLILKPDNYTHTKENYRATYLMKIYVNILNKY